MKLSRFEQGICKILEHHKKTTPNGSLDCLSRRLNVAIKKELKRYLHEKPVFDYAIAENNLIERIIRTWSYTWKK